MIFILHEALHEENGAWGTSYFYFTFSWLKLFSLLFFKRFFSCFPFFQFVPVFYIHVLPHLGIFRLFSNSYTKLNRFICLDFAILSFYFLLLSLPGSGLNLYQFHCKSLRLLLQYRFSVATSSIYLGALVVVISWRRSPEPTHLYSFCHSARAFLFFTEMMSFFTNSPLSYSRCCIKVSK